MKKTYLSLAVLAGAVFAQQPTADHGHAAKLAMTVLQPKTNTKLTVTSPAFQNGADIPYENTQYRGNIFPGLAWTSGPAGTQSYVAIMQGEPEGGGKVTSIHFTLFDIPASVTELDPGMTTPPRGATYGPNVHGLNLPYVGPHTHTFDKHAYQYQVFALDAVLHLDKTAEFQEIVDAMSGHVLAAGELVGLSARDPQASQAEVDRR
jgi:para-nitrobenzyl esterase